MRPTVANLNFTSRKRIERSQIRISGIAAGTEGYFILDRFDVTEYEFPSDAQVIVESWTGKYGFQRFEIGRLDRLDFTKQNRFAANDLPNATFRIKVVATGSSGKILGDADNIPVEIGGRPPSILPIDPVDLDNRVWWLEIDEETGPVLQMNQRLPDYQQIARDIEFRATIMPSVVYQIALWVATSMNSGEADDKVRRWAKALTLPGVEPSKVNVEDDDARRDFAIKAAKAFAKHHGLFEKYLTSLDRNLQ
jgi:hypothetical protein